MMRPISPKEELIVFSVGWHQRKGIGSSLYFFVVARNQGEDAVPAFEIRWLDPASTRKSRGAGQASRGMGRKSR